MFVKLIDIEGLRLRGPDGDVGRLQDALVDERWVVRYLVVSTGAWLGRAVVISPVAIRGVDWADGRIDVGMRRDQIRSSPDLLDVRPLTRSAEAAYAAHYGIPIYWSGSGIWASAGFPGALVNAPPVTNPPPDVSEDSAVTMHLLQALRGRHLAARDGSIGHVDYFIADDDSWTVPFAVVDTSNFIGGRHVLVATAVLRVDDVPAGDLTAATTTERIRAAPAYDDRRPIDSTFAARVHDHYGTTDAATAGTAQSARGASRR
jgi:hypothetical protein